MQPRHYGLVGETGLCSRGLSLLSLNSQVQDAPDLAALHFVLLLLTSSLHFPVVVFALFRDECSSTSACGVACLRNSGQPGIVSHHQF